MLDGTYLLQMFIATPLDKRYYSTIFLKPTQSRTVIPKIKKLTSWLVLRGYPILSLLKPPKEVKKISKIFKTKASTHANVSWGISYAQASKIGSNTKSVLKIKEAFPTLKTKNIDNIQHMIKGDSKPKPQINMTTKGPSRKQVIIPMNNVNKENFMEKSSAHITNMNRALKNIKTEVMVNFVWLDPNSIIIVTNKVTSTLELQTIKNYVKNANCINANEVEIPRLPQSKSYLKIIGISYLQKITNTPITSSVVEYVTKKNHIFNNVILASRSCIIKISPRLDIAII